MTRPYLARLESIQALSNVAPTGIPTLPWRALTSQPRFLLPGPDGMAGGWLSVNLTVAPARPPQCAAIRFDLGNGFDAGLVVDMVGDGVIPPQVEGRQK